MPSIDAIVNVVVVVSEPGKSTGVIVARDFNASFRADRGVGIACLPSSRSGADGSGKSRESGKTRLFPPSRQTWSPKRRKAFDRADAESISGFGTANPRHI